MLATTYYSSRYIASVSKISCCVTHGTWRKNVEIASPLLPGVFPDAGDWLREPKRARKRFGSQGCLVLAFLAQKV